MKLPISHFVIHGNSMYPAFKPGEHVLSFNWAYFRKKPQVKNIVIIEQDKRMIIKRIQKVFRNKIFALGDNLNYSTDSRMLGWFDEQNIFGKIIFKF